MTATDAEGTPQAVRTQETRLEMPAAIVHDWFQGFHGSERVVEAIRGGLFSPERQPDIYTFQAARELLPPELAARIVRESRLTRLPGVRQRGHAPGRWRYLLPYMPHYFARLDLAPYDLVISSSHACAVNVRPREDAVHICYCHTPMRYAWMPATEARRVGGLGGIALRATAGRLRRIDREASRRPDSYVANSTAVRERIRRFYGREATVVPPPVDVDAFAPAEKSGRFLWVHRLVAYKQPELVLEAFRGLPFDLTMVGVGPLEARLRSQLPPNVELRGWVSREELAHLYATASGFVHVAEEDFGISMVEALAAGTPVVGLARGGARDIVEDGNHGVLVSRADVEEVRRAVRAVAARDWDVGTLVARAQTFSRERFVDRFDAHVRELVAARS